MPLPPPAFLTDLLLQGLSAPSFCAVGVAAWDTFLPFTRLTPGSFPLQMQAQPHPGLQEHSELEVAGS